MAPQPPEATTMHELHDTQSHNVVEEDVPPDGGYGWVCVAACFTLNAFTWGAVSVCLKRFPTLNGL
jgi:hypothetical protein